MLIGSRITFFLEYLAAALFPSEIELYFTDMYELYVSTDIHDARGVTISFTILNDDSTCGPVNIDKATLIIFDKVGYLLLSNIMAHHKVYQDSFLECIQVKTYQANIFLSRQNNLNW